ncbi:putative Cystathionine gamma-synthase [Seiridium cardinale]|uniref:Cystathionine gamma-synthase n=1 Tax=Seiridium cardinale TaxID=138064 RepID=A0ABR2XJU5_9PEZI
MSGSVIVNPQSSFYEAIHARLTAIWKHILFPGDIGILASNCHGFVERVQFCSCSALAVANVLPQHPSVGRVNYPALVPTRHLYERYCRQNCGYGYVLSIIFHEPQSAMAFHDDLDVCKGTSIGANFTLELPYAQLTHFPEMDLAEANGVPRHINALDAAEGFRHRAETVVSQESLGTLGSDKGALWGLEDINTCASE